MSSLIHCERGAKTGKQCEHRAPKRACAVSVIKALSTYIYIVDDRSIEEERKWVKNDASFRSMQYDYSPKFKWACDPEMKGERWEIWIEVVVTSLPDTWEREREGWKIYDLLSWGDWGSPILLYVVQLRWWFDDKWINWLGFIRRMW